MPIPINHSDLAMGYGPVVHAIARVARMNRTLIGNLLRPLGVFPGQELLLMQLFERDGRSQADLVRSLDLDPSTVTKMLQRMERSGWIERAKHEHDRRVLLITLTDRGRALRDEVSGAWERVEEATVACLSEDERSLLKELLSRIDGYVSARAVQSAAS